MTKNCFVAMLFVAVSCLAKEASARDEAIAAFKSKIKLVKKANDDKLLYKMQETLKCYEDKETVPDDKISMCEMIFLNPQDQERLKSLR